MYCKCMFMTSQWPCDRRPICYCCFYVCYLAEIKASVGLLLLHTADHKLPYYLATGYILLAVLLSQEIKHVPSHYL